ncbi:hypothetical protein Q8A67_001512 [Cirrhinus molitorella]|uniref:Uncharacterized protein n=1 Tax=Cirrhinus molitorella TaxID=172907 RepID=A0AA88TYU6_9TELE|nr:hypothetical protein Q8A67_001512 [Cirrhinus molitorella]
MFFMSLHHPHRLRSVQAALCLSPISAQDKPTTAVIPVHTINSEDPSTTNTHTTKDMITDPGETEVCQTAGSLFREIMIMLKTAVFAAPTVILLQIICERRAERKKQHREEI